LDRLSDYDYDLPDELIAQTPLEDRAASRLLWLKNSGEVEHRQFRNVVDILEHGDLLVMNDTRVSAVRLFGSKPTGGNVEAFLIRDLGRGKFEVLLRPGKRLKQGGVIHFGPGLDATVDHDLGDGVRILDFGQAPDLASRLNEVGMTPLPPYIHSVLPDRERYQTVYGVQSGSAAAPTAGLHFTQEILELLRAKGVETATVTLHVGLDTFRPVQVENLDEHKMHGEECAVSKETAEKIRTTKGRIIAVGTTTVRTLETFAVGPRQVEHGQRDSRLFIRPGFTFNVVDGMFTNFHLPKTTMLLMISALMGRTRILSAYQAAVTERYRFLSFGDSMLLL
jgi:S-adenosylmethionine:tRNA ribosyltransferase-isomerase